jgi:hypothetical protein
MSVEEADCVMCEVEQMLRARSVKIRAELQQLNPVTEPNYPTLFQALVEVDTDYRMLKVRVRER